MPVLKPEVFSHASNLVASNSLEEAAPAPGLTDGDGLGAATSSREIHGTKWVVVCVSIYISCLMYGLDMTIAADVQATIIVQFDSVDRLAWVGSGFLLGSVCSIFPL
jgi:hypothetical protein